MNKKKKIVFYIDIMLRGGAQRVMSVLTNYFSKEGYEVYLINDMEEMNKEKEYALNDKVIRLYLDEKNVKNPFIKNAKRIIKLRKYLKNINPEYVISFLGRPNLRMLISSIFINTKKIVSVRNDPNKEYGKSIIVKLITNFIFLLADGYVFQTNDASKYFFKKIRTKSTIIKNPVDKKFYEVKDVKNKNNIITVGRLESQKNHKLLIDSFAKVKDKLNGEKLLIYGDGSLENYLKNYVNSLGLEGEVEFKGNVNNIEKILSSSKVFVLSSNYEGMPNALMEAMAVGVPCISTNCPCGGPKDLIDDGINGILVECNNVTEMSNAMIKMIFDYSNVKYGEKAKLKAEEFREEKILCLWEKYITK